MKTIIEKLKHKVWPKFKEFLSLWPGSWGILILIGIYALSYPLLLMIDGKFDTNVGLNDPGLLQNLPFTSLEIVFLNEIIFLGIMLNFPIVWHWYKKEVYKNDWLNLSSYQRWLIFLLLFSIFFFSGTWLLSSLQ